MQNLLNFLKKNKFSPLVTGGIILGGGIVIGSIAWKLY